MRIIGGLARGTKLYTLEGLNTRPTLDKVREAIFNILQNNIRDTVVLDLFAGSGAVGLESINKNAQKMRVEDKVQILCIDYENFLSNTQEKFDFIYIDPPYNTDYISNSIKLINDRNLLAEEGIIIAETDEEERVKDEIDKLKTSINIYDTRKYGRARLIFMRKE